MNDVIIIVIVFVTLFFLTAITEVISVNYPITIHSTKHIVMGPRVALCRCPLYSELPAQCTLVQTPGECCLKPVCNWNPTIQTEVTSGLGVTPDGMSKFGGNAE